MTSFDPSKPLIVVGVPVVQPRPDAVVGTANTCCCGIFVWVSQQTVDLIRVGARLHLICTACADRSGANWSETLIDLPSPQQVVLGQQMHARRN